MRNGGISIEVSARKKKNHKRKMGEPQREVEMGPLNWIFAKRAAGYKTHFTRQLELGRITDKLTEL